MRLAPTRLATVLAAVMAISPVLGTLHEASVRHVACPDDGELIEAPVQRAHAHAPAGKERALFPSFPSRLPRRARTTIIAPFQCTRAAPSA